MVREVLLMEIIAEIGQNHNGDMKLAKKLITKAKLMGADTVKFQVYNAKKLFQKKNNPWFEYNCKTELNFEQIEILFEECQKKNIEFMPPSTFFIGISLGSRGACHGRGRWIYSKSIEF